MIAETGEPGGSTALLRSLIDEVVERAVEQVRVPELFPATVREFTSNRRVRVLIDGDENPITVASLAGAVSAPERVMVLFYPPSGAVIIGRINESGPNYAGQVRVNYAGLSVSNFVSGVAKVFDLSSPATTGTVVDGDATTVWPLRPDTTLPVTGSYDPDFYDSANDRLKENPVRGQPHWWRVVGSYTGKDPTSFGDLFMELRNPDSGFVTSHIVRLLEGATSSSFTFTLPTIADGFSIPAPFGYQLQATTLFNAPGLTVSISSIIRFSSAVETVLPPP